MHRNTSQLEYMLVHISGIQSWVTTTLVVPRINCGKLKSVTCLVTCIYTMISCHLETYYYS